ncbi:MAG: DHH family phosphoesterase, partial [Candidatus Paceibacterota bacterium]
MKKYAVREEISDQEHQQLGQYPSLLKKLLAYREIKGGDQAEAFLNPNYEKHLHDPFLIKDMGKAVDRILKAFQLGEKIIIFGDYDADGIPGGVILHDFFRKIGFTNFENYIPHRHNEGFGLNENAIKQFVESGARLLITVDCGIANISEINFAQANGLDVIVTDHHLVNGHGAPEAFAIVNPNQPGCDYPNKSLCGAGVAFKLVQALIFRLQTSKLPNPDAPVGTPTLRQASGLETCDLNQATISPVPKGWEKWLLDMAGLATLSDMVPLVGENRALAHYGMKVLRKSPRVGLMKLLRKLKINQRTLNEDDIGFMITPRINAASRMGEPMDAFRLFATTDEVEADQVSDHLNKINDERKGIVASMVKEMKHAVAERYANRDKKVIVLGNPNWRPSLLGLAANTLAEEHSCPVFLWGRDGENVIKGSCRSD